VALDIADFECPTRCPGVAHSKLVPLFPSTREDQRKGGGRLKLLTVMFWHVTLLRWVKVTPGANVSTMTYTKATRVIRSQYY